MLSCDSYGKTKKRICSKKDIQQCICMQQMQDKAKVWKERWYQVQKMQFHTDEAQEQGYKG